MKITNKKIASFFDQLVKLMELHEENPYKIRSNKNAYLTIRKHPTPLSDLSPTEIKSIPRIGASSANKILEIIDYQQLSALKPYIDKTPAGIIELLKIKGIGPKKIKTIWRELKIETPIELLYACYENRLIELKGFGEKTQKDIIKKIKFSMSNRDLFLWANIEKEAQVLFDFFRKEIPNHHQISFTGAFRRKDPILANIELITDTDIDFLAKAYPKLNQQDNTLAGKTKGNIPFIIHHCSPKKFGNKLFETTGDDVFIQEISKKISSESVPNEEAIFAQAGLPYCPPELRWATFPSPKTIQNLITKEDIKGVIHAHSQWSDGHHSIAEMATASQEKGYEYLVMTDHSKSAFYARGLQPDRVLAQMAEIDELNKNLANFHIFKGIESDILSSGQLDYDEELLEQFDLIIASIHSNLRMDLATATKRLIKAIEHPKTRILGHLTGRLLLAREGYPIDFERITDACAANQVAIELNANPYRLDIDYRQISTLLNKGVKISINPDAHSTAGIDDIQYGVFAARKAGVAPTDNISSLALDDLKTWLM